MKIYLAGPIDLVDQSPEARHEALMRLLAQRGIEAEVWCPHCEYRDFLPPAASVRLNMSALAAADVMVCVWDATTQPSIGTPVEVWSRYVLDKRTVILGTLGSGLFAHLLTEDDYVLLVDSWDEVGVALEGLSRAMAEAKV